MERKKEEGKEELRRLPFPFTVRAGGEYKVITYPERELQLWLWRRQKTASSQNSKAIRGELLSLL